MIGSVVATGEVNGRKAAALVVDGTLQDLVIDPAGDVPLPGTILAGKTDRVMKGLGGQFVRLPGGQNGYLRGKGVAPGQVILVQITGFAEDGKAIPVSQKLLFKGRYAIVTPGNPGINVSRAIHDDERRDELSLLAHEACPEAKGAILRSAAEFGEDDDIAAEIVELHARAEAVLSHRITVPELVLAGPDAHAYARNEWDGTPGAFAEFGVDDMIDEMRESAADIPGGGTAYIEPTRALIAVDVNTGGDTSPAAGLKANIALARDLPRQLRCRGLSGQIVIDFAPFPKKDRRTMEQVLRAAFKGDVVETALVGWTPLGHYELQRKRERLPL